MSLVLRGFFLVAAYLAISLSPLFFALVGERPEARGFWVEFGVALGFVGLAMLGLQFALTARFQGIAAPFGIDIIIRFHREISLVAFALIVAHPVILFVAEPAYLERLTPPEVSWVAVMGLLSIVALGVLIGLSVWRERLKLPYEAWRMTHAALAVLAIGLAAAHVVGVGRYVATPWKQALWLTMAAGTLGLLLYVRVGKPLRILHRPYRVVEVRKERGNAYTLALEPVGHPGMRFEPGQFAWLTVRDSPFTVEEHPFSFSSSALHPERPEITAKVLGDFTASLAELEEGTRAFLEGPYGAFSTERHEGPGFVFLAGGIGITPIMSMLRTFAERGDRRPMKLVYANRTWEDVTFRDALEALEGELDLTTVHVLEEPPEGWTGETGYVTTEILDRHLPDEPERQQYFICGPAPMMDLVEENLDRLKVPLERIQSERFNLV
jgi:predicted ferric reductase